MVPGAAVARAPLMITLRGKALIFSTDSTPGGFHVTALTTYSACSTSSSRAAVQAVLPEDFLQSQHHHHHHLHHYHTAGVLIPTGR